MAEKVKKEHIEQVKQALIEGQGKVAKAIKLCRELGVPAHIFGELMEEGLDTVQIGDEWVTVLYGYRVDGIKYGGWAKTIEEQKEFLLWRDMRLRAEAVERVERGRR